MTIRYIWHIILFNHSKPKKTKIIEKGKGQTDGKADIHSRTSDFLIRIRDELYLIECQSYQDGSMAIRIAEYAFISAKQNAVWEKDRVILKMPNYCIVYVKNDNSTPEYTKITYEFPDGRLVEYDSKNILIANYSKEEILQKRLYPYVPYYILRYEKVLKENKIPIEFVKEELEYLLEGMKAAVARNELEVFDYYNIRAFIVSEESNCGLSLLESAIIF